MIGQFDGVYRRVPWFDLEPWLAQGWTLEFCDLFWPLAWMRAPIS